MAAADAAIDKLVRLVERRLGNVRSRRAVVTGVTGGLVTLRELGATGGGTERVAKANGLSLAPDDEVIVVPVNGKPFVVTKVAARPSAQGGVLGVYFADDYASIAAAADALNTNGGGTLQLSPGVIDMSQPLRFTKPVVLRGAGSGLTAGLRPTELRFAAGIDGIVLTGLATKSVVQHLAVTSLSNKVGAGSGVVCRAGRSLISDVYIEKFGDHGVFIDTAARTVTAATESGGVATLTVAGHGFVVGETVFVSGFTPAAYNGSKVITGVTTNTFTFAITGGIGNASVLGTCYAGNANDSRVEGVRAFSNGGDGIRVEGNDSNACMLANCDGSGNDGHGIAVHFSFKTGVYSPHANGNTAGDYYDSGSSNIYINPYAEGAGKFIIDTADSNDGYLLSVGVAALPTIWSGNPPVLGSTAAVNANWTVIDGNVHQRKIRLKDPAGTKEWQLLSGLLGADQFELRQQTDGKRVFSVTAAGDRLTLGDAVNLDVGATTGTKIGINATRKLALWGAATDVQPPANPDTSGATLAQLETEVNELKALLRRIGAMAP